MTRKRFGETRGTVRRKPKGPIGKVSRSQSVTTYGPGALYELRTFKGGAIANSVIIAGIHRWPVSEMNENRISEPTLAASLGVDRFLMPPSAEDGDDSPPIPAYRFPEWLECSECNRVGHVNHVFEEEIDGPPKCAANNCNGYGVPTRLVVTCYKKEGETDESSPGHIDNFPWIWWAHSQSGKEVCDDPEVYLINEGKKAGISGLIVECRNKDCRASRSLGDVFKPEMLKPIKCSGYRPWLGDRKEEHVCEPCERSVRVLLRGASNIYFPVPASAISIPPLSSKLVQEIENRCWQILGDLKRRIQDGETVNKPEFVKSFRNTLGYSRYTPEQIMLAVNAILDNSACGGQKLTESQQKLRERDALVNNYEPNQQDSTEDDFENEVLEMEDFYRQKLLRTYLQTLSKVHRLREVRAIRGFQRVESSPVADSYTKACAPISKFKEDWLPAIETRGEGIYFELSKGRLAEWECREDVLKHISPLVANFVRYCDERHIETDMNLVAPGYLMIHTLSHLLIKQLSLECGYSSASIRERLFYGRNEDEQWCGVLLYTASASADGTLGGLVRQGEPSNLNAMIASSLENARWCSSDPLCIESEGQGVDALNMAACHACALVSETSCEQRNLLLDRALLVGTPDNPKIGFFHEFLIGDNS
ncbi:DUF1998 domain-containing protein [Shewanella sp. SM96]|uniref:DUF1998 domain-containing protein n=1 Tax=Shewanella sp. SM96 TaxID=2912813 RepID=UPI0021DAEFEC|nr:DUF1998 domain-containing protein [Shewanella sp. SM96]MCU8005727.1 DUF1998 domain-containing protein [Shewanella sp. SM96]